MMIAMLSTQAQEISNEQWTIVTKTSATWCSNCGSWGWNLFKDLIDDNQDKNVIIWSSHNSGDLDNDASTEINAGWGSFGQPQFYVNSDLFSVTSSNAQTKRGEMNAYINDLVSFGALAGVGVDATYDGTTLNITGKAEFFTDLDAGNYHIGVYLLKDHVIAEQASQGSGADHRYVLSDKITDDTFGEQIVEGSVVSGATYTIEASKEIENVDLENDEVVIILWNLRVDGEYAFFNANRNSITEAGTTATVDILNLSDITTRVANDQIILEIDAKKNLGNVQSRLVNVSGQIIQSQNSNLVHGPNQIEYNSGDLNAGTYIIQITVNDEVYTEKVIIH